MKKIEARSEGPNSRLLDPESLRSLFHPSHNRIMARSAPSLVESLLDNNVSVRDIVSRAELPVGSRPIQKKKVKRKQRQGGVLRSGSAGKLGNQAADKGKGKKRRSGPSGRNSSLMFSASQMGPSQERLAKQLRSQLRASGLPASEFDRMRQSYRQANREALHLEEELLQVFQANDLGNNGHLRRDLVQAILWDAGVDYLSNLPLLFSMTEVLTEPSVESEESDDLTCPSYSKQNQMVSYRELVRMVYAESRLAFMANKMGLPNQTSPMLQFSAQKKLRSDNPYLSAPALPPLKLAQVESKKRLQKKFKDQHFTRETPHVLQGREGKQWATVQELRRELEIARAGLKELSERVKEDVQWVQLTCNVRTKRAHGLCMVWAAERISGLTSRWEQLQMAQALGRWMEFRLYLRNWDRALAFMRFSACRRLHALLGAWRCSVLKRYARNWCTIAWEMKETEEREAAICIQRHMRGWYDRQFVRHLHEADAALFMQKIFRGFLARLSTNRLRQKLSEEFSARIVQRKARDFLAIRRAQHVRRHLQEEKGAVTLQRVVRGRKAREDVRRFRRDIEELNAAINMQRVVRGRLARKKTIVRRRAQLENHAAVKVQSSLRQSLAKKRTKQLKAQRQQKQAATQIQKVYRGSKGRNTYRRRSEMRKQSEGAATRIQSTYRGHRSRGRSKSEAAEAKAKAQAATEIQRVWRGKEARGHIQQVRTQRAKEQQAATRIQSLQRGCQARARVQDLKTQQEEARRRRDSWVVSEQRPGMSGGNDFANMEKDAITIQRLYRGHCARKSYKTKKRSEEGAVVQIQATWRGAQGRQEAQRRRMDRKVKKLPKGQASAAATKVQSLQRGRMARKRVASIKKEQDDRLEAVLLDAARTEDRAKEVEAATRIQSLQRGRVGRKRSQEKRDHLSNQNRKLVLRQRQEEAAVRIQCLERSRQAKRERQRREVENKQRHAAAVRIQSQTRRHTAVKNANARRAVAQARREQLEAAQRKRQEEDSALIIQRNARGFVARKKLERRKEAHRKSLAHFEMAGLEAMREMEQLAGAPLNKRNSTRISTRSGESEQTDNYEDDEFERDDDVEEEIQSELAYTQQDYAEDQQYGEGEEYDKAYHYNAAAEYQDNQYYSEGQHADYSYGEQYDQQYNEEYYNTGEHDYNYDGQDYSQSQHYSESQEYYEEEGHHTMAKDDDTGSYITPSDPKAHDEELTYKSMGNAFSNEYNENVEAEPGDVPHDFKVNVDTARLLGTSDNKKDIEPQESDTGSYITANDPKAHDDDLTFQSMGNVFSKEYGENVDAEPDTVPHDFKVTVDTARLSRQPSTGRPSQRDSLTNSTRLFGTGKMHGSPDVEDAGWERTIASPKSEESQAIGVSLQKTSTLPSQVSELTDISPHDSVAQDEAVVDEESSGPPASPTPSEKEEAEMLAQMEREHEKKMKEMNDKLKAAEEEAARQKKAKRKEELKKKMEEQKKQEAEMKRKLAAIEAEKRKSEEKERKKEKEVHAAIEIQRVARGKLAREQVQQIRKEIAEIKERLKREEEERQRIAEEKRQKLLRDKNREKKLQEKEELRRKEEQARNQAATKIQSLERGRQGRKETQQIRQQREKELASMEASAKKIIESKAAHNTQQDPSTDSMTDADHPEKTGVEEGSATSEGTQVVELKERLEQLERLLQSQAPPGAAAKEEQPEGKAEKEGDDEASLKQEDSGEGPSTQTGQPDSTITMDVSGLQTHPQQNSSILTAGTSALEEGVGVDNAESKSEPAVDGHHAPPIDQMHHAEQNSGWEELWDENSQRYYWINTLTNETSWTNPGHSYDSEGYETSGSIASYETDNHELYHEADSSEWVQYYDESASSHYWYNNSTGETSWADPYAESSVHGSSSQHYDSYYQHHEPNAESTETPALTYDAHYDDASAHDSAPHNGSAEYAGGHSLQGDHLTADYVEGGDSNAEYNEADSAYYEGGHNAIQPYESEHASGDWVSYIDEESGLPYWYNTVTGEMSWDS